LGEQVRISLSNLGNQINIETRESKFPDGNVMQLQQWERKSLIAAVEVAKTWDLKGKDAMFTDHVPTWLTAAVAQAVNADRTFHYCEYLSRDVAMKPLPRGKVNPAGGIEFTVYNEGDKIYINYIADPPELKKHVYPLEKLPLVVVPEVPPNKHVFLWGVGATYIQVCLVKSYAPVSASVSLSNFSDQFLYGTPRFTCTISKTAERELGDVEPMYYPEGTA
jgi:hypothetical protein